MTDLATWQENNDKYLAVALTWLRLRLQRLAASYPSAEAPPEGPGFLDLFQRKPSASPAKHADQAEIADAARTMQAAADIDPPPALLILSQRFGLSPFEREVLLLCTAMELDTRMAGLCALAQDNPSHPYPTFALALALFRDRSWDVLSPERPLRYWRLIEVSRPGAQPLTASPLHADERIVNYVKGLNYLDDRLASLLIPFDYGDMANEELSATQQAIAGKIRLQLRHVVSPGQVVQLIGADSLGKQLVARRAAEALGRQVVRLPAESLPARPDELETLARLWERESILLPIALYLDAHDELSASAAADNQALSLNRFLVRCAGPVFLDTREVRPGLGRHSLPFDVDRPTPKEQCEAWQTALGAEAGDSPSDLAGQFNLNLPTIRQIAQTAQMEAAQAAGAKAARAETAQEEAAQTEAAQAETVQTAKPKAAELVLTPAKLCWKACRDRARPNLDVLAQRLEPIATLDDIVLPEAARGLLEQIASQVRERTRVYDEWGFRERMNRGLGISTLFAGQSGTGKTMAAEAIARKLDLNLYRIDLSAVVSKYIGETEKNLRRLFDAAEDGGAILFFDEADALFGKRSEVKDSHDRYANIEINYLLQRMEAYRGLAILATNMKTLLDPAFMRRLRFVVNFPFPGPEERRKIWQKVFPLQTLVEEVDSREKLDWERLARFNLTGGNIHAIALNAAFLAAARSTPVTMSLVLQAAEEEYRKLEKPVNEAEFRL